MGIDLHTLTGRVIQCIILVHQTLGPGFLESVYRRAPDVALLVNFADDRADFRRIESL